MLYVTQPSTSYAVAGENIIIINFHSHNTSLKNKNKRIIRISVSSFTSAYFTMQWCPKKKNHLGPIIILFTEDTKMWTIHLYIYIYTGNICYFTIKKKQGNVLEQDIQLCPFYCFPVTIHIAG
jgi:hypothetical protein